MNLIGNIQLMLGPAAGGNKCVFFHMGRFPLWYTHTHTSQNIYTYMMHIHAENAIRNNYAITCKKTCP